MDRFSGTCQGSALVLRQHAAVLFAATCMPMTDESHALDVVALRRRLLLGILSFYGSSGMLAVHVSSGLR